MGILRWFRARISNGWTGLLRAPVLLPAAFLVLCIPVQAQVADHDWVAPRWTGHVTFLGTNVLLGGLSAGAIQKIRGGDFQDGFARGSAGGALWYSGKVISARHFYGAGFLGRQVSALGLSAIHNAGEGLPALQRLVFPLGPLHLALERTDEGTRVQPTVVAGELAWAMALAFRSETRFDASNSLSSGVLVFRTPGHFFGSEEGPWGPGSVRGAVVNGSIVVSDIPTDEIPSVLGHERVHVLQHDFAHRVLGHRLEVGIMNRWGPTRRVSRWVEPGLLLEGLTLSFWRWADPEDPSTLPWEMEANFLDGQRPE